MNKSCRQLPQNIGGGVSSKERSSNLELFRIITMLLIVAHHYVVNSGLLATISLDVFSWRSIFLLLFGAWGKTGINCFVLITGYFMCKSKISAKKFFKLFFEVLFYKIVIWAIFLIAGYQKFSFTEMIKTLLPIRNLSNGFTSCYLVFFLFIPFLNILIHNMNEKQHIKLLILCVLVYVVIGTIPGFGITMNYVSWFIVLYIISSYISLYNKKIFDNGRFWGLLALCFLIVSMLSVVGMEWLGQKFGRKGLYYYLLSDSNKALAVCLSISAFLFFKNLKMKNSKFINSVAMSSFGVLLIHANSDAMRQWLWKDTLNNVGMYSSPFMVIHAIASIFGVYIICTIIDMLRIRFIEKPFFKLWDRHFYKVQARYEKIENTICNKLSIENIDTQGNSTQNELNSDK